MRWYTVVLFWLSIDCSYFSSFSDTIEIETILKSETALAGRSVDQKHPLWGLITRYAVGGIPFGRRMAQPPL